MLIGDVCITVTIICDSCLANVDIGFSVAAGEIPSVRVMASTIPVIPQVATLISTPATNAKRIVDYGAGILSPNTPLGQLVSPVDQPSASSDALVVSRNLPPIPAKLVEKIRRKEQFLPAKLGATEPTLGDLAAGTRKPKDKRAIHESHANSKIC